MSGNWDKRKTIPRKRPERKPVVREISNGDDDVIITRLGDDSVRWIKTRRPRNSDLKVALSIYEEKQFREIFDGFDFEGKGNVSLNDFKAALKWIRKSRHFRKMKEGGVLDEVERSFIAMDVDGDATVDFNEFCLGMTGAELSPFRNMTRVDMDKLLHKFVEFSRQMKRQRSLDAIGKMSQEPNGMPLFRHFADMFEINQNARIGHEEDSVRSAVKSLGKLQDDESIASNTVEALSPAEARSQKRDERQQLGASDPNPSPSPSPALDVQEALDSGDSETRARARSLALFKQVESGTDPEIEAARRRVEEERGYVLRTAAFRHERMDPVPARVAVPRSFVPRQRFERSTLGTQSADMQIRRSVTRDALRTLRTHTT